MVKVKKKAQKLIHHDQQLLRTSDLVERWKSIPIKENTIRNYRHEGKGPKWGRLGDAPRAPVVYKLSDVLAWEKKYLHGFVPPEVVR